MIQRFVILAAVMILAACSERWDGFVYERKGNFYYRHVGPFDSLEACRLGSRMELERLGSLTVGDYECGLRCAPKPEMKMWVCDKTER